MVTIEETLARTVDTLEGVVNQQGRVARIMDSLEERVTSMEGKHEALAHKQQAADYRESLMLGLQNRMQTLLENQQSQLVKQDERLAKQDEELAELKRFNQQMRQVWILMARHMGFEEDFELDPL